MQLEQSLTQFIIHQGGSINTRHIASLLEIINREQGRPAPDAEATPPAEAPAKKEKKK